MKKTGFLVTLVFFSFVLNAQQFGGFPPSTKWKQINSDTARVIFSSGAEREAARIATLVHRAAADTALSLGNRLRKINIVLQSRATTANGYVALGPFRSEYYLVPGSDIFQFGTIPWHEQLALHEYRHVQQYNNFSRGLPRLFFYLFGEQGQAFANAITIPDWFFEGDAVHAETALSPSGRGRLSYFLSGYNSLWLEKKTYNWQKLRNGSLKDYVPDHYQLGYLLTNYGYLKYGGSFWQKVTSDASRFRGVFYPLQKAIKKHSGLNYKSFREEALSFYRSKLVPEGDNDNEQAVVTDRLFTQVAEDESLIYLKRAYNKIPAFYKQQNGGEEKIALRSISSEDWFSYRQGKIAYTAFSARPRWAYIDYSDIVILDAATGKEKRISKGQRYYSPDFSPDARSIVAVHISDSLNASLQVLSATDGSLLNKWEGSEGDLFVNPRFVDASRIVVGIRSSDARMRLELFTIGNVQSRSLLPSGHYTIGLPAVRRDTVFFTGSFEGNDDLYALTIADARLFQLTSGQTGSYYATPQADTLVWSQFTTSGMQLKRKALSSLSWTEKKLAPASVQKEAFAVAFPKNILTGSTERLSARRYDKGTGLINFHSWAPSYDDPEFMFSLYSDNILNTFSNQLFYRYNQNEESHSAGLNTSYGGLFPKLNAGFEYIFDRVYRDTSVTIHYDQFEIRGGYNIPLNLTRGRMYRLLNGGSNYVYTRANPTGASKLLAKSTSSSYLHHFLSWSQYLPMARQHIYPRFGYTIGLQHRHRLDDKGFQFLGNAQLFLPSIANHSIVLQASWQETDTLNRLFTNRFSNSRGYVDYFFSRMWRLGANYHFPIVYPDLGIASIVYFQRLRGNLFYDYTRNYSRNKKATDALRSVGGELYFDTRWWNQLPVSFGVRVSYLLDDGYQAGDRKGSTWFSVILPLDLIPE